VNVVREPGRKPAGDAPKLEVEQGYDGWSRYRVTLREPGASEGLRLSLRREGLFSWQLTRVQLPASLFESMGKETTAKNDPPPPPAPAAPQHPTVTAAEKLKVLPGMSTGEMVDDLDIRPVLMALTGIYWPQFEQAMAHGSGREINGFVFAQACADKACSGDEAAIAVEKASGKAYAMLIRAGAGGNGADEVRWFGRTKLEDLPLPLVNFFAVSGYDVPAPLAEKAAAFVAGR
jgi:hypothetical protein